MPGEFDLGAIDPLIHSPIRLGVMAMLLGGDEIDFTELRDRLGVTDGNLGTHLRKLEEAGYVKCSKGFLGRRPRTTYRMLPRGRAAFERHVAELDRIVQGTGARRGKGGRS